eukprot:scaffold4880_cov173-Skeletonema_dohrnii-CCMP3373.AAC.6
MYKQSVQGRIVYETIMQGRIVYETIIMQYRSMHKSRQCTNEAVNMEEHGAKVERCSTEGCTKQIVDEGMCRRHGAKRGCSADGCTKQVVKKEEFVSDKHGTKFVI